jgi:alpha-ketoglutarate-dependent taurine dioxygenase
MQDAAVRPDTAATPFPAALLRGSVPGFNAPLLVQADAQTAGMAREDLLARLTEGRTWLDSVLLDRGALLLRGFGALRTADDVEAVARTLSPRIMDYRGGTTVRSQVTAAVVTASDAPRFFPIGMHQELSYQSEVPDRLLFFCETPPRRGGQTPLADMRNVYRRIPEDVRTRFERRGCRLQRMLAPRRRLIGLRTWPEVFETSDPRTVERLAAEHGWEVEWLPGQVLRLLNEVRPASRTHPVSGERVWFNQAHLMNPSTVAADLRAEGRPVAASVAAFARRLQRSPARYLITYGDGNPIPEADLDAVRDAIRAEVILFDWQRGDLLIVDNYLMAHGRRSYRGRRRILASLLGAAS